MRLLYISLISLCLISCKSDSFIEVFKGGETLSKVTERQALELIQTAFDDKQEVVFKKRPNFEYVLVVHKDGNSTEWLYSNIGVITEKPEGSVIYKVSLKPEQFIK